MESCRFGRFILAVEGIHKAVQKIKLSEASQFGLKGVHLFWMYELLGDPDGLAASELAERSNINRSLVSRELEMLREKGYVVSTKSTRRGYNAKIQLTPKGVETAQRIRALAMEFQNKTSVDIDERELLSFYSTLEKIHDNLSFLASEEEPLAAPERVCGRKETTNKIENKKAVREAAGGNI